uniref:Uncharacterized protein n=1 Tax=Romanomermis culicivorax TaxID=13658 RepID=A0A915L1E6_ROMCU
MLINSTKYAVNEMKEEFKKLRLDESKEDMYFSSSLTNLRTYKILSNSKALTQTKADGFKEQGQQLKFLWKELETINKGNEPSVGKNNLCLHLKSRISSTKPNNIIQHMDNRPDKNSTN